jgi:2-polyprenyl-3-methyl-5-hydroxy-6-metoxy-1,4-benzoquinol methylase
MSHAQSCPNCAQGNVKTLFIDSNNRVVRCTNCQLQFAYTYPEHEDADSEIYSLEYFAEAIEEDKNTERQRIFGQMLNEIESILGRKGRLLDIGAGEGTLMVTAESRGWQVEGTDISSAIVQHCRGGLGLTLHHGPIEDLALPAQSFDAIVLNHVLEHVRNPLTTMQEAARLLRDGGIVRVEVPNVGSFSSQFKNLLSRLHLKKSPWKHYSTDHHFWFYTPRTLKQTLETAGFEVMRLRAPNRQWFPSGMQQIANQLYEHIFWGGTLLAYARPQCNPST